MKVYNSLERRIYSSGFSLIELSIVLAIMGLLVTAVSSGTSLIQTSKIRKLVTSLDLLTSSVISFKQQYLALPGDMINAASVFGSDCYASSDNCNGDGNEQINDSASTGTSYREEFTAFQHLAASGYLTGYYNGTSNIYNPRSIDQLRISIATRSSLQIFDSESFTHFFQIGKQNSTNTYLADTALLSVKNTYSLDKKLDDGSSGTGFFRAYGTNCNNCADASTNWSSCSKVYLLGNSSSCSIYYKIKSL